ncbi:DciA family protein [Verticiella alkaliphila]|uniref:DciA family protein n=1 Tax=Verticiella alkaliphila TaxID=2779529 RepID=UPI00352FFA6E
MSRARGTAPGKKNRSPRRAGAPDALSWLNQSSGGASVMATAHRLLDMQRHLQSVLPPPLNAACQVMRSQDDTLTLSVPTPAHSAKLRQILPRLAASLQAGGWQVNEIRVRVQAGPLTFPRPQSIHDGVRPEIADTGVAAFAELRETLAEGPLADALARLLARRMG